MDQLWAPWRLSYVTQPARDTPPGDDCFICRAVAATDDRANYVVQRRNLSVVMLNRFPYNNGHLLVAPLAHVPDLDGLKDWDLIDLQRGLRDWMASLRLRMNPDGFNVGLNLGRAAGAGLPGHLHWHLVPRWAGDSNFMPVVADTRVIVQSLDALYDLLQTELAAGSRPS